MSIGKNVVQSGKVQQFAKRVAKVLTKETTEETEEEDTTADNSQKAAGTAGIRTPQSSGPKQRKTNNSKNAAKPHQTEQDKLIRVARMGELQEMVEETKTALTTLRKTIDDSEIEAIHALPEFGTSEDEIAAKNALRETKNAWSKKLSTFVADDAGTGFSTDGQSTFRWDDLLIIAVNLIVEAGVKTMRREETTGG